jgi:PAS domain S-box-containing protein
MAPSNDQLLSKIKVLEDENMALSERIEYSLLLNVITESIESTEDINLIIDNVLEKICILKHLPFAALFSLNDNEQRVENAYQLFETDFMSEKHLPFPEKVINETRAEGFLFIERKDFADYDIQFANDAPYIQTLLLFHLTPKFFPDAILLIVDSDPDNQLPSMLFLFGQVITYLDEKLDKLYYWTELQKLNNELEERVAARTADLEKANTTLEAKIKESRDFQRELLSKEKFIRSIYEAAKNISFITIDRRKGALIISSFSPGSTTLFGYEPEEVIGKPLSALFGDKVIGDMCLFEQGDRGSNLELQITQKSGDQVYAMYNSYAISNDSGHVLAELLVCIDISNLKQVQQQLIDAKNTAVKADSLKTVFLQNMSHEIRTPLNAIVGFADLLNNPDLDSERVNEFTGIISKSSSQLLSLVNDILDISKIESNQYEIRYELIHLRQMLASLHEQYVPLARQKGLDFVLELPVGEEVLVVKSDHIKLQQVLINLIGNAIKFTAKGVIKIGCVQKQDEVIIVVSDSGIGIAPENHAIIFDRFRQLDLSSIRPYRGTGLGLYICKTYMDLLGGKIWVESALDTGSTFYLSIPLSQSAGLSFTEKRATSPGATVSANIQVLVAEDEDTNFMLLEVFLMEMNIQITRANNGLEAVDLAQKNHYDLILMDIQMPQMDGLEATRRIREFDQQTPLIAITAFAFENERRLALDAGCNEHLSKPIKQEVLERTILEFVFGES